MKKIIIGILALIGLGHLIEWAIIFLPTNLIMILMLATFLDVGLRLVKEGKE